MPKGYLKSPQTLTSYISVVLAQERLAAWLLGALAVIGLILSLVGLYGMVSYSVAQRKSEIGIRVALGATNLDIVKALIQPAAVVSATGLLTGAALCAVSLRLSASMLFEVKGTDPSTWAVAGLLLSATALAAAAIPAMRASRNDPAQVLRES